MKKETFERATELQLEIKEMERMKVEITPGEFRELMANKYPYMFGYTLSDKEINEFLQRAPNIEIALDRAYDTLLSQGRCEVDE